jgi:hypothetical protein
MDMTTRTVALDVDAYERLHRAKREPGESFSSVVRRAQFPDRPITAGEYIERLRARMRTGTDRLPDDVLDALDAAQRDARVSDSEWL